MTIDHAELYCASTLADMLKVDVVTAKKIKELAAKGEPWGHLVETKTLDIESDGDR